MKTDPLFYELFQAAPQTFFELLQTTPPCPYKELSKMIRLTPLRETASFQEALQEEHVDIVKRLINRKFSLSPELFEALTKDLQKLELPALKALLDQVFDIHTVEQLEQWISERLPQTEKDVS